MIMEKLIEKDGTDSVKDFVTDRSYVSSITRYTGLDLKERSYLNKKIRWGHDLGGKENGRFGKNIEKL